MIKYIPIILGTLFLAGCIEDSTRNEARKQEEISKRSVEVVEFPNIINFSEKKLLKDILEMRDKNISTITYIVDMNGKFHKICDSFGFGIPYSTQYTNPQKRDGVSERVLPQADPNGLYSPSSSSGTWVVCLNPKDKTAKPIYIEPNIIVSPFPLD